MEAIIFYYTGTGNSLWVARTIAGELGDAELLSIADGKKPEDANHSKVVGLVFPVHIWGVPARILRFCNELSALQPDYLWAVAVNAGQVANTLVQLQKVLKSNGLLLRAGFEIPLPSNYIPWGGPGPEEKQSEQFESARKKISEITKCIRNKDIRPVERGPLWQHVLFTPMYRMSFSKVPGI